MDTMTRRKAVGSLGVLVGLAGAITLVPAEAKKHKKKQKKHKKGGGGGQNPNGNTPPPPPPAPQFETVTRTFDHLDAVGIDLEGPSKEYPAEIVVGGLDGGTIKKVTVRIPGFQHDFPDDVNILLVGPQGQNVQLMSDVGGDQTGTVLFDLTFDDDAPSGLPFEGPLSSGTFRPTNEADTDEYPAPAPAPDFAATLAVFKGTDPNGAWKLFVFDDGPGDGGVLIGGWSLTITAQVPA